MPINPNFVHNGITVNVNNPLPPIGPPGEDVVCLIGTAPDKASSVQDGNPVRVASVADHALIDSTGNELGSLIHCIKETHKKAAVVIYAITVPNGTVAAEIAAVVGGIDATSGARTGIQAAVECGERPTIIAAPGFNDKAVIDALASMGNRLAARIIVDGPGTTSSAAIALSAQLGSDHDHVLMVDPKVDIYSNAAQSNIVVPASVVAVGALASVKAWESWQNQSLYISGTSREISYNISDKTTEADLLNKNGITAICRTSMGGWSIIGNRTVTGRFVSHVGLEDAITRKLQETSQIYMGQNLTKPFMEQVVTRLNNFMQGLRALDALIDAEVYLHPTLNTGPNYENGQWAVALKYGRYSPNEHTVFEIGADSEIVNKFVEGVVG